MPPLSSNCPGKGGGFLRIGVFLTIIVLISYTPSVVPYEKEYPTSFQNSDVIGFTNSNCLHTLATKM